MIILVFIGIIAFVVYKIVNYFNEQEQISSVTDLSRGEWSERKLIPCLINKCGIDPRAIYHDLYIRKKDGTYTQIDLVVPTPQGIIVFEIKDYSGWIFGSERSKYWMQVLAYGKEKHQFYNPIKQNESHITALRNLLPNNPNVQIFNIVVFFGNCRFKELDCNKYDDTRVIYDTQVASVVQNILTLNPGNYGNKREVADVLADGVRNGQDPAIREAQRCVASRASANGNAHHSYSFGWRRFFH